MGEQPPYLKVSDFLEDLSKFSKNERCLIALLNCDFNAPSGEKGIKDIFRIESAVPSIRKILKSGVAPLLASHYERPDGFDDNLSLELTIKQHLSEAIGMPVRVIPFEQNTNSYDKTSIRREYISKNYDEGLVSLLENTRFHPSQIKNDGKLAKDLAEIVDIVINISFGTVHRKEDTNSYITALKPSFAGDLLAEELEALKKIECPKKPYVIAVGGDKVVDSLKLIEGILKAEKLPDYILVGGHVMLPFIYTSEMIEPNTKLANQVSKEDIKIADRLLQQAKANSVNLIFPRDYRIIRKGEQIYPITIEKLVSGDKIVDVGESSIKRYCDIVSKSKTVLWNGPLGMNDEEYVYASRRLIDAINSNDGADIIAGGGSTSYVIRSYKRYGDWFNGHLSTGGGALISGASDKLPAIEALAKSREKLLEGGYGQEFEWLRNAAINKNL